MYATMVTKCTVSCLLTFSKMTCQVYLLVALTLICYVKANLESVTDEDLEKLIITEKFVIALIPSEKCPDCDELERQLSSIREDLVDSLNAWVVKVVSSKSKSNFTTTNADKPLVVYFRQSIPMLYDGPLNDEIMLDTFIQNQEPAVSHLNDNSFEHLTQAASGATTGDWFVMFYRDDCEFCLKFLPKWEYVAAQLKGRINLAKVNVMADGISTGSRFSIDQVPAYLFFRQGKAYKYTLTSYEVQAFKDFALGWYKNAPSKAVPVPKTPFDELVDRTIFLLKENPLAFTSAGSALLLGLVIILIKSMKSSDNPKKSVKTKRGTKKVD